MFTTGRPTRPFVDVAFLEAEQRSGYSGHDTPEMLAILRDRGAKMGCDAVVLGGLSARSTGDTGVEVLLSDNAPDRKGIYATCIMYTSPEDGQLTAEARQAQSNQKCLEQRQKAIDLANRVSNEKARANILGSAPKCEGDVLAR